MTALERLARLSEAHRAEKVRLIDKARTERATWTAISAALGHETRQAARNWRLRQPESMPEQSDVEPGG